MNKTENNISYKKIIHYNYKNYNSNILFKSKDKNNNNNIRKASTLCLNNKNTGNYSDIKHIKEIKRKKAKTRNNSINKKYNSIKNYSLFSSIIKKSFDKISISNKNSKFIYKKKIGNNIIKNKKTFTIIKDNIN